MNPRNHYSHVRTVACLILISFSFNASFADENKTKTPEAISGALTEEVSAEISSDLNNELKKIQKTSDELRTLQKAQKAGLSNLIKRISPEGGEFVIQPDGAIRIIPKDDSVVKKLLSSPSLPEPPGLDKAVSTKAASEKDKTGSSSSQEKISESEKKIMRQLHKANNKGLVDLLEKLAPGGGKFELIENGGVRITPDDTSKSRELSEASQKAKTVAEGKGLKDLSKSLKRIGQRVNTWGKVRKVANGWIQSQNRKDLLVGKIRRVNRLYIVSIVTKKGHLDSQIVTRISDGKAVLFSQKDFEILN